MKKLVLALLLLSFISCQKEGINDIVTKKFTCSGSITCTQSGISFTESFQEEADLTRAEADAFCDALDDLADAVEGNGASCNVSCNCN